MCKYSWTDWDAVWWLDSGWPEEACIRWGCKLAHPGNLYHWTVHVRRRFGLLSTYFDHLLLLFQSVKCLILKLLNFPHLSVWVICFDSCFMCANFVIINIIYCVSVCSYCDIKLTPWLLRWWISKSVYWGVDKWSETQADWWHLRASHHRQSHAKVHAVLSVVMMLLASITE